MIHLFYILFVYSSYSVLAQNQNATPLSSSGPIQVLQLPPPTTTTATVSAPATGKYYEYQSYCREPIVKLNKKLINELPKSASDIDKTLFKAHNLMVDRAWSEAITLIEKSLLDNPKNEDLLFALAKAYKQQGNLFEAKAAMDDLLKINIMNPEYFVMLCALYTLDSNHKDAELTCNKTIKKFPDQYESLIYLGISLRERENFDGAIQQFDQANQIKPSEFAFSCKGESLILKKDYLGAVDAFKSAIKINNKSYRSYMGLAQALLKLKKSDLALRFFANACYLHKDSLIEMKKNYKELTEQKSPLAEKYFKEIQKCSER